MENRLQACLKAISVLSKPHLDEIQGAVQSVDQVLACNLKLASALSLPSEVKDQGNRCDALRPLGIDKCLARDTRWDYCCFCMEMVLEVAKLVDADSINCNADVGVPLLSVQQERDVAKCLQLVVAFGLLPNLMPNVGIPVQKRSKWHNLFASGSGTSEEQKYSRLTVTVRALCEVEKSKSLGPKFAVQHLADLLAALLQLCHAPISNPTSDSELLLWQRLQQERRSEFIPLLSSLIDRTYGPLLVQSLLLLQGPSSSHAKVIRDAPPPAPKWLIRTCAHLLTQQLTKPNGLAMTIRGVLDVDEITSDMWKRCDSLAYIISTPPSRDSAKQRDYYALIGPQLLELVKEAAHKGVSNGPMVRIACACYRDIAARHRYAAEEPVFRPLFRPLLSEDADEQIRCIEALHTVFVYGSDPSSSFLQLLEVHSRRLMELYRRWSRGVLQVRTLLEELLVRYIRHSDSPDRVGLIRSLLVVQAADSDDQQDFLEEDESNVTALLSLLQRVADVKLTYSVLVSLLEDLPQLLVVQPLSSNALSEGEPHLLQSVRRGLVTLKVIGVLSEDERLQRFLLDHPRQAVDFAQVFLKRAADNLHHRERFDLDLEKEGLAIVFAVIALQIDNLVGREGKCDIWSVFDRLVEPLEMLAKMHSLERIRSGADELRVAIQTRGFVFEKRPASGGSGQNAFQAAWDQLSDPLLPVQGHAILTLSSLLKRRDEQALKNKDRLLNVFLGSLEHEDSYIYLMAVQALAALADVYTEEVVSALVHQLEQLTAELDSAQSAKLVTEVNSDDDDDDNDEDEEEEVSTTAPSHQRPVLHRPPEVRLKVGEALLQVVRLIGPLVPKFKKVLLDSFLRGTKDKDPFVRASCLHNLGELCGLLRYSIGSVAQELLCCVSHLVRSDPAVEVRRAAALLINLLLRGLDTDALHILEPIIKDLYRVLKEIVLRDDDDRIVTYHASQGLEKLAEIVKHFLTTPSPTGKMMRTLRLP